MTTADVEDAGRLRVSAYFDLATHKKEDRAQDEGVADATPPKVEFSLGLGTYYDAYFSDDVETKNQGYELDMEIVNPNGGAIGLGHPIGTTGARQVATLLPELRRRNAKYGLVSMCVGGGQGGALILENLKIQ